MDGNSRIDELEQKFNENPRRFFAPLANEYRKAGNVDRAIAICRAHLGQLPGHMSGQIVYGQALFENGEYEEARTVFENALGMDRENLIALRHLGDLALRSGDTALARQWYTRLLDVDPKDATVIALVNEVDAAQEAEDSTAASRPVPAIDEDLGDQAIPQPVGDTELPQSPEEEAVFTDDADLSLPVPQAFVTETMAELYLRQGFPDRAADVYRRLADANPADERLRARATELEVPAAEDVTARREEPPSIESPEGSPDEQVAPSIDTPSPPTPAGEPPSEESTETETSPVDSPPPETPGEEESVEASVRDEPRAEPVGIAASHEAAPVAITVREFFVALGRHRPRAASRPSATNGNGRPSVGSLSLGVPSADDEHAANVLSAAFSSSVEQVSAPREAVAVADRSQTGRESEEDVASFRAWLDGLTGQ